MLHRKSQLLVALFTGIGLVVFDQLCKNWALSASGFSFYFFSPWFGWEFFQNPGVAFGIPVPGWIMTIITPPIILGLGIILNNRYLNPKTFTKEIWGLVFIMLGAVSNFIDRITLNYTVDYLRLFYSVINIADVMILFGLICLLSTNRLIDKNN